MVVAVTPPCDGGVASGGRGAAFIVVGELAVLGILPGVDGRG
ncbi:hypothetical protein PV648_16395 [Streptomyces sp. ID05-47C]|nr:hypothetical protein [Streptomyces sp. ID05-47C]